MHDNIEFPHHAWYRGYGGESFIQVWLTYTQISVRMLSVYANKIRRANHVLKRN